MLFGSEMLEVAIGLAFFYLLLSIVCSSVTEGISWVLASRAKTLKDGIRQLLTGGTADTSANTFLDTVYAHPLIESLVHKGKFPSYLQARTFSGALLATVADGAVTFETIQSALAIAPDSSPLPEAVRKPLLAILARSQNNLATFQKGVEAWYDDAMDRISGWYKRRAQAWTLLIALVVTAVLNANTFALASGMINDPTLRAAFVAQAAQAVASPGASAPPTSSLPESLASLQPFGVQLGWSATQFDPKQIDLGRGATNLVGWLVTILALGMGAPFWFDTVNRLVSLRATGTPPKRSDDASSP